MLKKRSIYLKKIFVFIFFGFSFLLLGCKEEITAYDIKFYDYSNQLISEQNVENVASIVFPSLEEIIIDDEYYDFLGWDFNNDGKVDEISTLSDNLDFYPVYEKRAPQKITIEYQTGEINSSIELFPYESFTLPIPNSVYYFLGYYDERNNPITNREGVKLFDAVLYDGLKLTPKFLITDETIKLLEIPKTVVDEEYAKVIDAAIEDGRISRDTSSSQANKFISETTFIYQSIKYEIAVASTKKNNIFHDYTHVEKDKTYYFKYEPVEFYVISADYENNKFEIVTTEIVGVYNFDLFNYLDAGLQMWGEHRMAVRQIDNSYLDSALEEIALINQIVYEDHHYDPDGTLQDIVINSALPKSNYITDSKKTISDFLLATTDIEVGYEYENFFSIPYVTGEVLVELNPNSLIVGYDWYGNKVNLDISDGTLYGQLCLYSFALKNIE